MTGDLQKAIYNRLVAVSISGVKGIYDNPTQVADPGNNALFPIITISDATASEWDDDTYTGFDTQAVIHVWSRAHHTLEAKSIQKAIYNAMHRHELSITGSALITCEHQSSNTVRDPDGVTIHGISQYRIISTNV